MTDFFNLPISSKSRKSKRCIWCGDLIHKGDDQVYQSGVFEGRMSTSYWHPECWRDAAHTLEVDREFTPYSAERPGTIGAL